MHRRGVPQVDVAFDIDRNGIIKVSAKDKATGKEQSIKIEGGSGLSKEDVEKMKRDAEEHAADDLKKAELVQTRNEADALAYQIEGQLKEHGEKIPAELRGKIESSINSLREALQGDDLDAIKKTRDQLMQDAQEIGKTVYEEVAKQQADQAGADPTATGDTAPGTQEAVDDVIDAEFEVKDSK